MTLQESQVVQKFRLTIRQALDNALVESGHAELIEDRSEDIAYNLVELDADLEIFATISGILIPYIEEWQMEKRIKKA